MAAVCGIAESTPQQTYAARLVYQAKQSLGALVPRRSLHQSTTPSLRLTGEAVRCLIYTPILPWQTRLLKLLPGQFCDPLRCELHVADITFASGMGIVSEGGMVEFDAVSYSWGRPELTASIECNLCKLPIPPAMADALKYLRDTAESRWLWCDAICINQVDASEKSSQVKTMLTIFAKARKVVAWLGFPEDESASLSDKVIAASDASFWKRGWIYQEVFAAQDLELRWGHTILATGQLENIERCKGLLAHRGKVDLLTLSELPSARETQIKARSKGTPHGGPRRWNATSSLQFLLSKGQSQEVSDDRDRVYAMLGVLNNRSHNALADFPINYSKSIEEVSTDLSGLLLTSHRYGRCWLYQLHMGKRSPLLPSWAFDLRDFAKISEQISVIYGLNLQCFSLADPEDLLPEGRLRIRGRAEGILGGPAYAAPGEAWRVQSSTANKMFAPVLQHYILRKVRTMDGNQSLQYSALYCPPTAQVGDMLYSFVGAPGISPFVIRATRSDTSDPILEAQIVGPAFWAIRNLPESEPFNVLKSGLQDRSTERWDGYAHRATSQDFFNSELGRQVIDRHFSAGLGRPCGQTESSDGFHELHLV